MVKPLSQKTIQIIKNTAELITTNDTLITKKMYSILFQKYPHFKIFFKDAPENQYMKLADALSSYAVNVEKLHILRPALSSIAKEHVRVSIKPSHYPIIGMALIQAIEEVLGDSASLELIDAWREAYKHIGDVLIEIEKEMYELQER